MENRTHSLFCCSHHQQSQIISAVGGILCSTYCMQYISLGNLATCGSPANHCEIALSPPNFTRRCNLPRTDCRRCRSIPRSRYSTAVPFDELSKDAAGCISLCTVDSKCLYRVALAAQAAVSGSSPTVLTRTGRLVQQAATTILLHHPPPENKKREKQDKHCAVLSCQGIKTVGLLVAKKNKKIREFPHSH